MQSVLHSGFVPRSPPFRSYFQGKMKRRGKEEAENVFSFKFDIQLSVADISHNQFFANAYVGAATLISEKPVTSLVLTKLVSMHGWCAGSASN